MSDLPPPIPPLSDPPPHKPKAGLSGCWKAAIIVAILGLIAVVGLGVLAAKFVKKGMSTDPAQVSVTADAMVEFDEGQRWHPAMQMNMGIFRLVVFVSTTEGMLMLMEGGKMIFKSEAQFEKQMRAEMTKNNGELEGTRVIDSRRESFRFGELERELLVSETVGETSGAKYLEVSGTIPSKKKGKMVFIYLREKASAASLDDIRARFDPPEAH